MKTQDAKKDRTSQILVLFDVRGCPCGVIALFFCHPSRAIRKSWKYWCFLAASLFYWIATTLQREAKIIKQGLQNECQKHTSKSQISVLFGVRSVKKTWKKWCKKWWKIGQFSAVWCFASSYRKLSLKILKSRYQCWKRSSSTQRSIGGRRQWGDQWRTLWSRSLSIDLVRQLVLHACEHHKGCSGGFTGYATAADPHLSTGDW